MKILGKKLILFILITLSITIPIIMEKNSNNQKIAIKNELNVIQDIYEIEKLQNNNYVPSEPIYICGDDNLTAQATVNSWPGNGTTENPYVIENLLINTSISDVSSFTVINTTSYLCIKNNYILNSDRNGISLNNVSNTEISNNTLKANHSNNIHVSYSQNILIRNNTILYGFYGIYIERTNSTIISKNYIGNNDHNGLLSYLCPKIVITENNIIDNKYKGILVIYSDIANITSNKIDNNSVGIKLEKSHNSYIMDNVITQNSVYGISLEDNLNTVMSFNNISNNNCGISFNTYNYTIMWNNFVDNYNENDQYQFHYAGGISNLKYNYWSDWVNEEDINNDGIIESPYGNLPKDSYPMKTLNFRGKINLPSLKYIVDHNKAISYYPYHIPSTTSNITTEIGPEITIGWGSAVDSLGYNITYDLYYSIDYNNEWELIASEIDKRSYRWNITNVQKYSKIMFRITAINEIGRSVDYFSNFVFTVKDSITIIDTSSDSSSTTSDLSEETNSYLYYQLIFTIGIITIFRKKKK